METTKKKPRGKPFAPGNPGGPGRPRREVEAAYLAALHAGVSMENWRAVIHRAVLDAVNGDDKARSWLSKYLLPATDDDLPQESETAQLFRALITETQGLKSRNGEDFTALSDDELDARIEQEKRKAAKP